MECPVRAGQSRSISAAGGSIGFKWRNVQTMTERTIRSMAKELAGVFYDENRSEGFRRTFPTLKAYMRGQWHKPDGEVLITKPGWVYHIDLARKVLASMLTKSSVSDVMKQRIYDALLEENEKAHSPQAQKALQRINTVH